MELYPFRFKPLFRQYIWGGRRLQSQLNKPIGEGDDFAESWELVDHANDQSVCAYGPLAGHTLADLIETRGVDLLGESCMKQISGSNRPPQLLNRFPLLMKYLDANRVLSVQVHPDDRYGSTMDTPDLGKTESWFVLHAEPDSVIYAGLKEGVTESELRKAVQEERTEDCLHTIHPKRGDCVFIPAGTVHAIGAGLVIAEIQQSSDTTFRLFDWNRVDKEGNARPLHIEQSFEVIDFERGPVQPQTPTELETPNGSTAEQLVECDKFILNRWKFEHPIEIGGDGRFRLLTMTSGSAMVEGDPSGEPLALANTMLIPACLGPTLVTPDGESELLEISVPE